MRPIGPIRLVKNVPHSFVVHNSLVIKIKRGIFLFTKLVHWLMKAPNAHPSNTGSLSEFKSDTDTAPYVCIMRSNALDDWRKGGEKEGLVIFVY